MQRLALSGTLYVLPSRITSRFEWEDALPSEQVKSARVLGSALRERSAQGRSHLLHLESREIPEPLAESENNARTENDLRRNHCLTTWAVGADVGKMGQDIGYVYGTSLILQ